MKKLFIWDLHGVLEKGNDLAVVEITNTILKQFGYSKNLSSQESLSLSGKRWQEYFASLLPDQATEEHLKLQDACFALAQKKPEIVAKHVRPNDHSLNVLSAIQESPHDQILISNTKHEALLKYIQFLGFNNFFPPEFHFGADSHSQKKLTKQIILNQYLENKHYPGGIITIGDSPGDMALIDGLKEGIAYLYRAPHLPKRPIPAQHKINDLRSVLHEI